MSEDEVFLGSGNVFADLGDSDAQTKLMKARVAAEIIRTLGERRLDAPRGAALARVKVEDIQRIVDADLSRYTLDRLVRIAFRLGCEARLEFGPQHTAAAE